MTTMTSKVTHPTFNALPENTREAVIDLLAPRLADAIDLQFQAKMAHWNVRGPSFMALHELFDDVAEAMDEYVDLIAERIGQLGGQVHGTVRSAARASSLDEYPVEATRQEDHVEALSRALAAFGESVRHSIEAAGEVGDAGTEDLFTEVSRGVDKWLWFVESHRAG